MIITNKNDFVLFWSEARGKTFDEQLAFWDKIVESQDKSYFEKYVHATQLFPNWQEMKRKKAELAFAEYPLIYEKMVELFDSFEKIFNHHLIIFQKHFPDFFLKNLELRVIANVKRFLATSSVEGDKHFLAFSIDFMASVHNNPHQISGFEFAFNPKTFYAHEFFHIYQAQNHPLIIESERSAHKFIELLWSEGLAVFVSGIINPDATVDELLVFKGIHPCYLENKYFVHQSLLQDLKDITAENFIEIDNKWRNISKKLEKMPIMPGYAVGYAFISELANSYSLEALLNWNIEQIENELHKFLLK